MIRTSKSLSTCLYRLVGEYFLLRQSRLKTSHRYNPRDEDDDDRIRKKKENQEGYIHFLKSRGQHILTNPRVLDAIVRKSDVLPTDTVLEIGPGTGNLTMKLLESASKVVAVEIDKRMIEFLNKRSSDIGVADRLTVICDDALKTEFPPFDIIVANIPYGISSPLIAKLVFGTNHFRSATLLLQKEFARRLLANPGDSEFNRLAVNVKLVADVEFIMDVSKRDFLPCPKVDSSVVKIKPKAEIPDVNLHEWLAFTRTCFSKKNKTLGATFKQKKKVTELYKLSRMAADSIEQDSLAKVYSDLAAHDEVEEEEEGIDESNHSLGVEINSFRDKMIEVLKSDGFNEKRPSKLANEELLHLLSLFNREGIYFHGQGHATSAAFSSAMSAAL
ncbi:ribosomal RNA small subunit methyltransferase, mitochondrial [Impatiens glandulifera]|uniref:ribosomal RNA small subunit methyltransferase, mitochondrial n=1 Tax=Impatiens glandulifera TaxID=253017 RepID=UPI001FB17665|nr:ribosomal RNA small subunit methyltransferase, mitochondrial [Impatiens glandulifera]